MKDRKYTIPIKPPKILSNTLDENEYLELDSLI